MTKTTYSCFSCLANKDVELKIGFSHQQLYQKKCVNVLNVESNITCELIKVTILLDLNLHKMSLYKQ